MNISSSHCHKHKNNLIIYWGSIQISSKGDIELLRMCSFCINANCVSLWTVHTQWQHLWASKYTWWSSGSCHSHQTSLWSWPRVNSIRGCHGGNKHFEILQYLSGKVQNVVDARSLSAYQAQIGRVFALHVVLTFSIDLSGVNSTKTKFIPLVLHPRFE